MPLLRSTAVSRNLKRERLEQNNNKSNATYETTDAQTKNTFAYSNILKILQPKVENFEIKNSDIFHISVQNIHCVYFLEPP